MSKIADLKQITNQEVEIGLQEYLNKLLFPLIHQVNKSSISEGNHPASGKSTFIRELETNILTSMASPAVQMHLSFQKFSKCPQELPKLD